MMKLVHLCISSVFVLVHGAELWLPSLWSAAINPVCSTSCSVNGTASNGRDGSCICKSNVRGDCCDQCAENTYRDDTLDNCVSCNCITAASNCSEFTGACICREGVTGQICDKCETLYYNTRFQDSSTCTKCPCNANGTIGCDLVLATDSYSCTCKLKANGTLCDECAALHFPVNGDYGRCTSCSCNEKGTMRCSFSGKVCLDVYAITNCLCMHSLIWKYGISLTVGAMCMSQCILRALILCHWLPV